MIENYSEIFNALPFPCIILEPKDDHFLVRDVNVRYCELSGIKKEDIQGNRYPQVISGSLQSELNVDQRLVSLRTATTTKKTHKIYCLRNDLLSSDKKDFKEGFWQVDNIPLTGPDGEVRQILNIARDITPEILGEEEKIKIQGELKNTLEKQNQIIEKNSDGIYSLDKDGNFLNLNTGLAKIAEMDEEEMIKLNFIQFCSPHHKELTVDHFQKVLQGQNQEFIADFISAKGNERVLNITLIPMKVNSEIAGTYGIAKDITNYIKSEEALQKSQKKFRALVKESSDLLGIVDLEGNYKFVSETSLAILGIPPEDFLGKNAFDYIHPEDRERVYRTFISLKEQNQVQVKAFRFGTSEGRWLWLETTATNLTDDPHIEGVVINSRDITEVIERTQEISGLYERYRLAAEATENLVYDRDLQTDSVIRFYKEAEKFCGYSLEEIEKRDFWKEKIHPDEASDIQDQLKKVLASPIQEKIKARYRLKCADGSYTHLIDRAHIIRDQAGKPVRLIGAINDISEIVEKENALKVANQRFSLAMEASNEMMWDWDIRNNKVTRSSSFQKLFANPANEIFSVKNNWLQKIDEKDKAKVKKSIDEVLANPKATRWRQEYRLIKDNGEKIFVIDRANILRDKAGRAVRMVGAVLDVTESRAMIKRVKLQNKVLKEVAWEQAHVVKAPLARLKGLLNIVDGGCSEEWTREEVMELISVSVDELEEIIENIIRKTEKTEAIKT